ncbi:MAG: hypothetical protein FGM57_03015 [Candidatus Taylorbacteria bacterium]|nr:hypothetical protein [Candidatus Taylorbacteria bacterium]
MLRTYVINFISKIGLGVPLLYVFLISIFNQSVVIAAWPSTISKHVNEEALVLLTLIGSAVLIAWLFSGKKNFEVSTTILALLLITTASNLNLILDLTPLICLALGLTLRYYPRIRVVAETKVSIPKENGGVHTTDDHDQHIFVPKDN